ncbi:MAG: ATP-binding protein [Bacteroidetes bacterium]|nr:ATP-binding protein [Bacteroidota bacterium]
MKEYINNDLINEFSKDSSIECIFDNLYKVLAQEWQIVEMDLFLVDENKISKLDNISSSVTLENIYNELEERGLLDFAVNTNQIKIIPNIDDNIEKIKSIIIIPIILMNKISAYFIANSPLNTANIDTSNINNIHLIAKHSFALINTCQSITDKNNSKKKYNLLKQQTILASNQIAISELLVALNNGLDIPQKIIKTNLELIQKNIGDNKRRISIIEEQFNSITNIQNKIQELSNEINNSPQNYNVFDIIEETISIANPILNKHGITLLTNIKENIDKNILINCFKIQIIFAIYNFISSSIYSMQNGGTININIFKNDNTTQKLDAEIINIIVSNDGVGFEENEFEGSIIANLDLSNQKIKSHLLYKIAQNIIIGHKGKISIYSDQKGTTFKIQLKKVN